MQDKTFNDIISIYLSSGKLTMMVSSYVFSHNYDTNKELQKDFVSEIVLILLEYKHKNKIIALFNNQKLDAYIARIIHNEYVFKYSKWNKLYGNYERGRNDELPIDY